MSWNRKKMWLAVEDGWAGWIDTPNSGANASPSGWSASGDLLNGGAFQVNSWGTHKNYTFEWSAASSPQQAQFMQSLRSGIYGKGLIHFIEPTLYDKNILPARVASPALSLEDEGRPLVPGASPQRVNLSDWQDSLLPLQGVRWDVSGLATGYRGDDTSIFVPIPDGYSLAVGARYEYTGSGRIFVSGSFGRQEVYPMESDGDPLIRTDNIYSGSRYARIWIGKDRNRAGSVTLYGLVARLIRTDRIWGAKVAGYGELPYGEGPYGGQYTTAQWRNLARGPWVGGMGHTGVRFNGTPTLVHNTGVDGGQVSYAASFTEVGAWN